MYYATIEEEQAFLNQLWRLLMNWEPSDALEAASRSEQFASNLVCPKCGQGDIVCHGFVKRYHGTWKAKWMEYCCPTCGEKYDKSTIIEDIYAHTPFSMIDHLDTPLGIFQVLQNGTRIPFKYRTEKTICAGQEVMRHLIDIDTNAMRRGDAVFAGIPCAGFAFYGSDEQCVYYSAENQQWLLFMNAEEIIEIESCVEQYTFRSDGHNDAGCTWLIHQNTDEPGIPNQHHFRVIKLILAWGERRVFEDHMGLLEEAVW